MRYALTCLVAAALASGAVFHSVNAAEPGATLTHRTPSGFVFSITADGLEQVTLGDRTVLTGDWHAAVNVGGDKASEDIGGTRTASSGAGKALVATHGNGPLRVQHSYRFAGETLFIESQVINDTDRAVGPMVFSGLVVDFDGTPRGALVTASKRDLLYPSNSGLAGSYAIGKGFVLGLTWYDRPAPAPPPALSGKTAPSTEAPPAPRGSLATWKCLDNGRYELSLACDMTVPPGGADTVSLAVTFSRGDDWHAAMAPYKRRCQPITASKKTVPRGDHRPVIKVSLVPAGAKPTDDSPLGLPAARRIDRAGGGVQLANRVAVLARTIGARTVFLTDLPRYDPSTGWVMNWHILPEAADRGVKKFVARLAENDIATAVEAWPRAAQTPVAWDRTTTTSFDPFACFDTVRWTYIYAVGAHGWKARGFLLRGLGTHPTDGRLTARLRRELETHEATKEFGANVFFVADGASDLTWPLASVYTSVAWSKEQRRFVFDRGGLAEFALARWLDPELPIYVRLPPDGLQQPDGANYSAAEFLLRNRLTPVIPLAAFEGDPALAGALGKQVRRHMEQSGRWSTATTAMPAPPAAPQTNTDAATRGSLTSTTLAAIGAGILGLAVVALVLVVGRSRRTPQPQNIQRSRNRSPRTSKKVRIRRQAVERRR